MIAAGQKRSYGGLLGVLVLALAVLLLVLTGCAPNTVYVPTEQLAAQVQGFPAARYPVPPESPRGDVTVSSRGVAEGEPQGGGPRVKMLNLQIVLSNDGDAAPWTFDGRAQRLMVAGVTLAPAMVAAGPSGGPVVTVPPGDKRTVDLFFAPPPGTDRGALGAFDALWTVQTGARPVTERTPFERREAGTGYSAGTSVVVGVSPLWWYDPWFLAYRPSVIRYGHHPYWGYRRPGERGPIAAPPVGARASAVPAMPSAPRMSAPARGPSMPSAPHTSGPVR